MSGFGMLVKNDLPMFQNTPHKPTQQPPHTAGYIGYYQQQGFPNPNPYFQPEYNHGFAASQFPDHFGGSTSWPNNMYMAAHAHAHAHNHPHPSINHSPEFKTEFKSEFKPEIKPEYNEWHSAYGHPLFVGEGSSTHNPHHQQQSLQHPHTPSPCSQRPGASSSNSGGNSPLPFHSQFQKLNDASDTADSTTSAVPASPPEDSPDRPNSCRSPYDWIKKNGYAQQNGPEGFLEVAATKEGKTRTKDKYRVVYSDHQRLELEKEFHFSKYITIRRKAEMASNLGLSERQVKIWFQNRRAKDRKQLKKREDGGNKMGVPEQHMAIVGIHQHPHYETPSPMHY